MNIEEIKKKKLVTIPEIQKLVGLSRQHVYYRLMGLKAVQSGRGKNNLYPLKESLERLGSGTIENIIRYDELMPNEITIKDFLAEQGVTYSRWLALPNRPKILPYVTIGQKVLKTFDRDEVLDQIKDIPKKGDKRKERRSKPEDYYCMTNNKFSADTLNFMKKLDSVKYANTGY